jgi:hypothetical protein
VLLRLLPFLHHDMFSLNEKEEKKTSIISLKLIY